MLRNLCGCEEPPGTRLGCTMNLDICRVSTRKTPVSPAPQAHVTCRKNEERYKSQ
jgi:hypothetical protein